MKFPLFFHPQKAKKPPHTTQVPMVLDIILISEDTHIQIKLFEVTYEHFIPAFEPCMVGLVEC